eukprot:736212_1
MNGINSGADFVTRLSHPGQQDVKRGNLEEDPSSSPSLSRIRFFSLRSSSVPSSQMVKSAAVFVSKTKSNPIAFSDATSFPAGNEPGSRSNSSGIATRTEGAT